jgi:putative nucleotidyltransferase with HDIG domain
MFGSSPPQKSSARRTHVRDCRPDTSAAWWDRQRCNGVIPSVLIAVAFWVVATAILMLREDVLSYRPGQMVRSDVIARVDFAFPDDGVRDEKRHEAMAETPRLYKVAPAPADATDDARRPTDVWQPLQDRLLSLPEAVAHLTYDQLPPELRQLVRDTSSLTALQQIVGDTARRNWARSVERYVAALRRPGWVILPAQDRAIELAINHGIVLLADAHAASTDKPPAAGAAATSAVDRTIDPTVLATVTIPSPPDDELRARVSALADDAAFRSGVRPMVIAATLAAVRPTFVLDEDQTARARNTAADNVRPEDCAIRYRKNEPIVHQNRGIVTDRDWQVLQAENRAFLASVSKSAWRQRVGIGLTTLLLTVTLAAYTAHFQPRVVRNHARGVAIAILMASMLLLAQLAGLGTGPLYLLAVAPTLLVGMILTIAYDQRFAVGVAANHAMMVTIGLDQRVGFLLIIWVGIVSTCFLLGDIRSRSKLILVGGVAALAMMATTCAWGMVSLDPWPYVTMNCLYAGAAGLSVGFVVLGILPFVEQSFRITTGMTLLELADASHVLLRRLAADAPGTHSHSWQVAALAEAAAEAIGANSLLCRVAAYYHDVGKIHKADYFVENQQPGQQNRHFNLTPNVSFLIIKGHVADGVELAREYNLPASITPFIQQHHGTTLVEYFYRAARSQAERRGEDPEQVSDVEFRYPGPKPQSKEVAILMLADAAESATRAMTEPTPGRIEALVHDLATKRMTDGQFDDCALTFRDLERIERSLVKTLLSLYHGRIAYPSTAALTDAPAIRAALAPA